MSHYREEEEARGADIPREEMDDEAGCLYPGRCVVTGLHTPASCAPAPREKGGAPLIPTKP